MANRATQNEKMKNQVEKRNLGKKIEYGTNRVADAARQ